MNQAILFNKMKFGYIDRNNFLIEPNCSKTNHLWLNKTNFLFGYTEYFLDFQTTKFYGYTKKKSF